jgi:hypothetical protein
MEFRMVSSRPRWIPILAVLGAMVLQACGAPPDDRGLVRLWTDDFEVRLKPNDVPPRALERITYTITVHDKNTREPIVNGEGQLFATNSDRHTVYNGLEYGPEAGTYRATITFITAGDWAMGFRFRRDSTKALQRTEDWRQQVRNEAPPGQ